MPKNIIPGAEVFTFRTRTLHGALQRLGSVDELDHARHRLLKRNGAIIEPMGWKEGTYQATCVFVGEAFRAEVEQIRREIREDSAGVLVHPLYGRVRCRCVKITGDLDVPTAANSATLTLDFVEDEIDAKQTATASQGVAAKAAQLELDALDLVIFAATFVGSVSSLESLQASAETFAANALAAVSTETLSGILATQLGDVQAKADDAMDALRADDAVEDDVDRFDAISQCEMVYASALDLADAVAEARPAAEEYTVPGPTSAFSLLQQFYGRAALDRLDEFLNNNPDVTTPHLIPTGTVVTMAARTV